MTLFLPVFLAYWQRQSGPGGDSWPRVLSPERPPPLQYGPLPRQYGPLPCTGPQYGPLPRQYGPLPRPDNIFAAGVRYSYSSVLFNRNRHTVPCIANRYGKRGACVGLSYSVTPSTGDLFLTGGHDESR